MGRKMGDMKRDRGISSAVLCEMPIGNSFVGFVPLSFSHLRCYYYNSPFLHLPATQCPMQLLSYFPCAHSFCLVWAELLQLELFNFGGMARTKKKTNKFNTNFRVADVSFFVMLDNAVLLYVFGKSSTRSKGRDWSGLGFRSERTTEVLKKRTTKEILRKWLVR